MNPGIVDLASNIRTGGGTPLPLDAFLEVFPQFAPPTVPRAYLEMILAQANAAISERRWHSQWKLAVCLYVAHFATLWLKTSAGLDASSDPSAVASSGESGGVSSKSVGGVSVSYSQSEGASDLAGYGSWKETEFGLQLATMARLVGRGMMVVR